MSHAPKCPFIQTLLFVYPHKIFPLLLFHDKIGIQIIELIKVADCASYILTLQYDILLCYRCSVSSFCHRQSSIRDSFDVLDPPQTRHLHVIFGSHAARCVHSPWICTLVVVQSVMIAPANPHSSLAALQVSAAVAACTPLIRL